MNRYTRIDFARASEAGAGGAVARDVLARLDAGETVWARNTGEVPSPWTRVTEVKDWLRPRLIDGSDDLRGSPPSRCYSVPRGSVASSGGGFYFPHELLVEDKCGYPADHWGLAVLVGEDRTVALT